MRQICLAVLALLLLGGLTRCQPEERDPCVQETITDPNYFSTARTLQNTCTKGDGADYYLAANQTYRISADLVIEPGTKIVVGDSAALIVEPTASIYAIGRVDAPVEFTSDNPTPGAWHGILIQSAAPRNTLQYVHIDYAGGAVIDAALPAAALSLADGSAISLANNEFLQSAGYGLALQSNAVSMTSMEACKFTANAATLRIPAVQTHKLTADNSFTGNAQGYIDVRVGGTITDDISWVAHTIPYRLFKTDSTASGVQTVGGNGRLGIEKGATLEFNDDTGFLITGNARFFASGTASDRILFTGVRKAPGVWRGLDLRSTRISTLEYTSIEHAGSSGGAIYMWNNPTVDISNVNFSYCPTCAIVDAPKTASQPPNPNLSTLNVVYTHVDAQYCKAQ